MNDVLLYLYDAHAEARVLGQALAHLAARLGTDLKGRLEGSPLLRGQDGARSLGSPSSVLTAR